MSLHDSESKQTTMNLLTGIVTMLVQFAVSFFLSPYIVKTLGEEANGFAQLANNFVSYATLLTLAFNSMASRFMSVNYHQGKHDKVKEYYSSLVVCNIVICAILIPITGYLIGNLNRFVDVGSSDLNDVRTLFGCVFINFYANLVLSVFGAALFVVNKIYIQNVVNLLRNILNAVLLLCVFSLLPPKMYYVSFAAMVWTILSIPLYKMFQKRYMPQLKFSLGDYRGGAVKEMFFAGVWNTVNQCGHMLMTGLDLLLTNLFIDPVTMGVLSVAKTMPNVITTLAGVLNSSFAPTVTMNWSKGNVQHMLNQLRSSMKISSIIISIPLITFCSFGEAFYTLWMPTLDAKMLVMLSFLTCMAFIPWAGPQALYNVFTATNHLKVNSIAFVSTGILNVFIVYLCLKFTSFGVYAVAGVSSTLTILRNLIIIAPYTAKLLHLKWYTFYKDMGISVVCCAIDFAVAVMVSRVINADDWLRLILAVCITCIVTLLLDLVVVLNKRERTLLSNKLWKRGV